MKKQKAIFFDRDGIVNKRIVGDYVKNPTEFEIIPEFLTIFDMVKSAGYLAILVTNQQGIGKGVMTENDLKQVHDLMQKILFINTNYYFDDIYFCPDLAGTESTHRKPRPGMLLEAIEKWSVDAAGSWMIGDSCKDAIAGKRAGCRTILLGNYEQEDCSEADFILANHNELRFYLDNFFVNSEENP